MTNAISHIAHINTCESNKIKPSAFPTQKIQIYGFISRYYMTPKLYNKSNIKTAYYFLGFRL